jgi:hypothetical protein
MLFWYRKKKNEMEEPQPLPATTTIQQDKVTEGQRRINLLWETTQSLIAKMVVISGLVINMSLIAAVVVTVNDISVNRLAVISLCLQFINLTAGIVIGFYFSRTNHTQIGGIGPKKTDTQEYEGR